MLANTLSFPFLKSTGYALKRHVTFADQEVVSMGGWGPRDNFFSSMGPSLTSLKFSGMGVWALCHPVDPRAYISLLVMKCYNYNPCIIYTILKISIQ